MIKHWKENIATQIILILHSEATIHLIWPWCTQWKIKQSSIPYISKDSPVDLMGRYRTKIKFNSKTMSNQVKHYLLWYHNFFFMNMILICVCLLKMTFYKDGFISIDFSKLISLGGQRKSHSIFYLFIFFGGGGVHKLILNPNSKIWTFKKKYLGKLRHEFVLCVLTRGEWWRSCTCSLWNISLPWLKENPSHQSLVMQPLSRNKLLRLLIHNAYWGWALDLLILQQ